MSTRRTTSSLLFMTILFLLMSSIPVFSQSDSSTPTATPAPTSVVSEADRLTMSEVVNQVCDGQSDTLPTTNPTQESKRKMYYGGSDFQLPVELQANALAELRYAICVEVEYTTVQECIYREFAGFGSQVGTVIRQRPSWLIAVRDITTGETVQKQTFQGGWPVYCPQSESFSTLWPTKYPSGAAPAVDDLLNWLRKIYYQLASDALVLVSKLNVRAGPGTQYLILGQLSAGEGVTIVGQFENCAWLNVVTPAQQTGWISGDARYTKRQKACEGIASGHFRPLTALVKAPLTKGVAKLMVENHTATDALVILATTAEQPVMAAYIRHGESHTLQAIPTGTYMLYISYGAAWDNDAYQFTQEITLERFIETLELAATPSKNRLPNVTLQDAGEGAAQTETVSVEQFSAFAD